MKKNFSNQKTPILQNKITKNPSPLTSYLTPHTSNLFFSLLLSAFCLLPSALFGQVTIGKNAEPQPYSVLELYGQYETGSYGGLRLPQLTNSQRNAIILGPEASGLMIYNLSTDCIEFWNSAKWISFCENGGTDYVEINGVKWAKFNVNEPGYFADHPYDAGMFYQWNRRMGWSSTNPMINSSGGDTWDNTGAAGTTWETANDPCPTGWRVPNSAELNTLTETALVSRLWVTNYLSSGVNGYILTDINTGSTLFLPAAGQRYYFNGSLFYVGELGYYWSSTPNSTNAYRLYFDNGNFGASNYDRAYGLSVRCVKQ